MLTVMAIARYLGVSRATVYKFVTARRAPS
ncbi:hypothetical protein [Cystobacter fuscus]